MTLVHLQIAQVSKYIFFENSDLKKIHNENIVFQKFLTIKSTELSNFIKCIIGDEQFQYLQQQENPPDFHGDTLSDGVTQLNLNETFRNTIVKDFTIGGHELFLISELPENGRLDTGKVYLKSDSGHLSYVLMDPKDNNNTIGDNLENIAVPREGLTKEFLDSKKHDILEIISKKGHTTINTYTFYGIGIDIHTGDIFTRMKDKETGEKTVPITKSNPRDYNGNIKDNGNIEVKYRCPDRDEPFNKKKGRIIKLNFHIEINEEYEYQNSKNDFTKQLKEMFGNEKDSFIKKHENYIIELSNMGILNFKSISNKPMALNLKKMSFYISKESFEKQFKGPHNNFPEIDKDKEIFIGSNIYRLNGKPIYFQKGPNNAKSYIELKYRRYPIFSDDLDDLIYQPIEGNGDCLYKVLALYCGRDQEKLQADVNKKMKTKSSNNTIINELMQLLKRPIMIVNSKDRKISNLEDLRNNTSLFEFEPIFLYYTKEFNHYDVLILRDQNISGVKIFNKLMQNDNKKPSPSFNQVSEVTIQCEIIFDEKCKDIQRSKKWFYSQIKIKLKELDDDPQIFRVAIDSVDTILGSYKELIKHEETLETKKDEMLKFFKEKMKKTKEIPLTYESKDATIKEEQIIKEFSSCRIL